MTKVDWFKSRGLISPSNTETEMDFVSVKPRESVMLNYEVMFKREKVLYAPIVQTELIRFTYNLLFAKKMALAYVKVTANGSGVFFTGMTEHSGSAGFDRTAGTINIIMFFYDGDKVYYSVQQENVAVAEDTTVPTLSSAVIAISDNDTLTLTFSEELDPASLSIADFDIVNTTSTPSHPAMTDIQVASNVITITVSDVFVAGNVYQLTYSGTSVQDLAGNKLAAFSGQAISNNLAIYNPSSYSTHAIINWMKARALDGVLSDGATFVSTTNSGTKGGGTYIVQGTGPTFETNELNGTGVLRFNGTNQAIRSTSTFVRKNVYTKFLLFKPTAGASGTVDNHYSLYDAVLFGSSTNKIQNSTATAPARTPNSQPASSGTYGNAWTIVTIRCGATTDTRRINGTVDHTQASTGASGSDSAANNHFIGFNGINGWLAMDMAEAIIVEGEMSDVDIEKFEGYLAWTFNLQSLLPVGHTYKNTPPAA